MPYVIFFLAALFISYSQAMHLDGYERGRESVSLFYQPVANNDTNKAIVSEVEDTPLFVAIKKKNIAQIKSMIEYRIPVTGKQVIYAWRQFFGEEFEEFDSEKIKKTKSLIDLSYRKTNSICKNITKTLGSSELEPIQIQQLSGTLQLFCTPTDLALIIVGALQKKDINEKNTELLFKNYSLLFGTHNKALTTDDLKKIIDLLAPFNMEKYLLLLILDTYEEHENSSQKSVKSITVNQSLVSKTELHMREVAAAIIEESRQNFLKYSLRDLVKFVLLDERAEAVDHALNFYDSLANFVRDSIKYPVDRKLVRKNYQFWDQVYHQLEKQGDFASAVSIAAVLNSPSTKNRLPNKYLKQQQLIDNNGNFFNQTLDDNLQIPPLAFTITQLIKIKSWSLFLSDENGREQLNFASIAELFELSRYYRHSRQAMEKISFKRMQALQEAISLFPKMVVFTPQNADEITNAWIYSYNQIMPKSSSKSF